MRAVLNLVLGIAAMALTAFIVAGFLFFMLSRDLPTCDQGSFYSYREHACIHGHRLD